jgi:predicted AlkP superfamily pyrophosphatase or phosphodiesterase
MIETGVSQSIRLDSLIDPGQLKTAFGGPLANLYVTEGRATAITVRNQINARLQHGRAYLREEVPERYRYRADPRAGDVVVVMNESWTLATSAPSNERKSERWGMHGWDPALEGMRALFLIAGPDIRGGVLIPDVQNVDVYPLMTELLGLTGAPGIDGRGGVIRRLIGSRSARVPGCQGARVPGCQGARVPGCQGAKVPKCQGAMVPKGAGGA